MVSLSSDRTHSGGYFGFSDDCAVINTTDSDDDLIVDHIELVSGPELTHKPIRISWAIILAKFVYIALGVSAFVIPLQCNKKNTRCGEDPLSLTLYIHGGMWFVLFVLDRYLQHKHDENRLDGYLDFYRKTRNIRRMPMFINSCANAVLVVVIKVLDNHCDSKGNCTFLSKTRYIQILIIIECAVALVVLIIYLVYIVRFNNKKALPDVTQTDVIASYEGSHRPTELGCRNDDDYHYQVMEKQADMIRYLQQHTEVLAKRNLKLTDQLNKVKGLRRNDEVS